MSTRPADSRSSAARNKTSSGKTAAWNALRYGTSTKASSMLRGYLSEEERANGAAIKKAIEGVISDLVFELLSETAERCGARV